MKRVRIAQIGIAHDHATSIFDSLLRLDEIFEVKGFCVCDGEELLYEQQKEGVYARAARLTLEEVFLDPKPDAVVIEAQEDALTRYARLAIEAGVHVHMDKPGSTSQRTFEELMRSAEKKRLTVHLGYMYRYNPAVRHAMEVIERGGLGEIYSVEAHMDCLHEKKKRQWLGTFPGGMMYFLGCHLIDLIVRIQGVPEEVIPLNMATGFDNVTGTDYGMAVLKYPKGISFAKTSGVEPGGFLRRQLVICGEKGTIEIRPFEKYVAAIGRERNMVTGIRETCRKEAETYGWNYQGDYRETEPVNRYDPMMTAFAAMVRGEKENPYTYAYEITLHEILLKACGAEDLGKEGGTKHEGDIGRRKQRAPLE